MKAISVLGSTGSIGTQTLEIVEDFPDRFKVVALTAGRNLDLLLQQIQRHAPEVVALAEADLVEDPLAGEGLGDHADHKAEHGGTAVEAFGGFQLFGVDLGGGGVEEPTLVGLG